MDHMDDVKGQAVFTPAPILKNDWVQVRVYPELSGVSTVYL
jgi:hypothetical protein